MRGQLRCICWPDGARRDNRGCRGESVRVPAGERDEDFPDGQVAAVEGQRL